MFIASIRPAHTAFLAAMFLSWPLVGIAESITLTASKDTFLRAAAPNTNEGSNPLLSVRRLGKRTALVSFDLLPVDELGERLILEGKPGSIATAVLRVYVAHNDNNWGSAGRSISVYKTYYDWSEGNGNNAKRALKEKDSGKEAPVIRNRGGGAGATWNCPSDSSIKHLKKNCASDLSFWNGGYYFSNSPSSTVTITNATTEYVDFDVKDDVETQYVGTDINENFYGWAIRRTDFAKAGSIWFHSREGTGKLPELIVTFPDQ